MHNSIGFFDFAALCTQNMSVAALRILHVTTGYADVGSVNYKNIPTLKM